MKPAALDAAVEQYVTSHEAPLTFWGALRAIFGGAK